jgi:hypothetical protein
VAGGINPTVDAVYLLKSFFRLAACAGKQGDRRAQDRINQYLLIFFFKVATLQLLAYLSLGQGRS